MQGHIPPLYNSIDIRHADFKLAPIDVNAFPGGFNNLSEAAGIKAVKEFKQHLNANYNNPKNILLIPENHTRNQRYLDNVAVLQNLIIKAGFNVQLGSIGNSEDGVDGLLPHAKPVKQSGRLVLDNGFVADAVILNNDLTAGASSEIIGLDIPVLPHPLMGWYNRRKSSCFYHYDILAREFASRFGIDAWQITTESEKCVYMNFKERKGLDCVAVSMRRLSEKVQNKYNEYAIKEEPYVFVKADSGTYGMGIMTAKKPEDITEMNKNVRKKMNVIKEGVTNSEVIMQEGVRTIDSIGNQAAEAMAYVVNGHFVGGAFRINAERGSEGNMNGPGVTFRPFEDVLENEFSGHDNLSEYLQAVSLIAELSAIAATREQEFYKDTEA